MRKLITVLVATLTVHMSIHARPNQESGKLLFENDQLRAVEFVVQPAAKLSLQSHAPFLFFSVNPLVATLTFKGGKNVPVNLKIDDPRWYEKPLTAVANKGQSEVRFVIIELKKPAPTNSGDVSADDGTKVAPDVYKVLLENRRVRIVRVGSKPGQNVPMHSHPGSSFRYPMANTKASFITPDGTKGQLESKTGVARWTELPTRHAYQNIGGTQGHTLLVEIK